MFGLNAFIAVHSLDQGYELLTRDKNNVILGGTLWMRMGKKQYHTGIDLSGLGLDRITETDETIEIGSMTSLRQMEIDPLLHHWYGPLFEQAFSPVVGVQFRNLATLGGSVYSRFGFSDVITALMVLETQVHLHQAGVIPLAAFMSQPRENDIIVKISIPKKTYQTCYQSMRMSATDFPVLSAAMGLADGKWRISIGARPSAACLAESAAALLPPCPNDDQIRTACESVVTELSYGTNLRGSQAYREILARVLVRKGIKALCR